MSVAAARLASRELPTPLGRLRLVAGDATLVAVLWPDDDQRRVPLPAASPSAEHPVLRAAANQLDAWFAGGRDRFDLPLDRTRGTAFQRSVWSALGATPPGSTVTYGGLAASLGRPSAARAVGAAVGRNPLSVVVPCHRVVGAGGRLTGFAGGLEAKRWLLRREAAGTRDAHPEKEPGAGRGRR